MTREQMILEEVIDKIYNPSHRHYATTSDTFENTYIHFVMDGVNHHHPILSFMKVVSGTLDFFPVGYYDDDNDEFTESWLKRDEYFDLLEKGFTLESH